MKNNHFNLLEITQSPSEEALTILSTSIIGTPGRSMLYQHTTAKEKINKIVNPYFINLRTRQRLIGTCCLCKRMTSNCGKDFQSFYIRYFSFLKTYRSNGTGEKNKSIKNSHIKKEIKSLLDGTGLDLTQAKFFHYAYVDFKNTRSVNLCKEFGFEAVREYSSLIFNRIKPFDDPTVQLLDKEDEFEMKLLLRDFYSSYNMFTFENLFNGRNYFVIRNIDGKVLAGLQVNPDSWKIYQLAGTKGKILLSTFSNLPYLNKMVNKNYKFLAVDGIYISEGNEKYLEVLLESVLAKFKVNNAIICLDADSKLFSALLKLNFGLINKLNKKSKGSVIIRMGNCSMEESLYFKKNPVYISGIDVT